METSTLTAEGGCHCGAVRFRVRFQNPPELLDCNCSMCSKTGYLHLIATAADFTLLSGADALTDYRFNSGTARHLFCKHCGIKSVYVPRSHPDGYSINWRALDNVEAITPIIHPYDGKNWETARAAL
nr:GFA family protein [Polymorphobacter sp.]